MNRLNEQRKWSGVWIRDANVPAKQSQIRRPVDTISLVDVVNFAVSWQGDCTCSPYRTDDGIPDPRHSGGCNIAWVDGHESHVSKINRNDPYTSDPFRNGEDEMKGLPDNYWDRE